VVLMVRAASFRPAVERPYESARARAILHGGPDPAPYRPRILPLYYLLAVSARPFSPFLPGRRVHHRVSYYAGWRDDEGYGYSYGGGCGGGGDDDDDDDARAGYLLC